LLDARSKGVTEVTSTGNSQELDVESKSKKTEPIGCSGQSGRVYWKLGTVNLIPPFQAHSLTRLSFLLDFWFQISETKRRTLEYPQPQPSRREWAREEIDLNCGCRLVHFPRWESE